MKVECDINTHTYIHIHTRLHTFTHTQQTPQQLEQERFVIQPLEFNVEEDTVTTLDVLDHNFRSKSLLQAKYECVCACVYVCV